MSFKGMRKSIRTMEAPTKTAGASAHLSDEFPAGYSLTGCSPALPASASPAASSMLQRWPKSGDVFCSDIKWNEHNQNTQGGGSHFRIRFFCPTSEVHFSEGWGIFNRSCGEISTGVDTLVENCFLAAPPRPWEAVGGRPQSVASLIV